MVLIIGDPVFIKQGSNITAELGDLIADGDAIGVLIFISKPPLLVFGKPSAIVRFRDVALPHPVSRARAMTPARMSARIFLTGFI